LLVSVSFGGGGDDDTGLGDDALVELSNFDFEGSLGSFKVGNDSGNSGVFSVEGSDGSLFVSVLDVELSL
jgi:hypothetical protein